MRLYNIGSEATKSKFLHTESGGVACLERTENSTGWDLLYTSVHTSYCCFPSRQFNSRPVLLSSSGCSSALFFILIIHSFKLEYNKTMSEAVIH